MNSPSYQKNKCPVSHLKLILSFSQLAHTYADRKNTFVKVDSLILFLTYPLPLDHGESLAIADHARQGIEVNHTVFTFLHVKHG